MSKILSKIGKKKKELLERKRGGKKSKIGSDLNNYYLDILGTIFFVRL